VCTFLRNTSEVLHGLQGVTARNYVFAAVRASNSTDMCRVNRGSHIVNVLKRKEIKRENKGKKIKREKI
jgi:hypothetical protein